MEGVKEDNVNILGEGDTPHPLLQPAVLRVLFPMLSLEDIASCRLVCEVWRTVSLSSSSWRTNVTLKFTEEGIVNNLENPTSTTSLVQFTDFWVDECAVKPFKQFHISGWSLQFGDYEQTRFFALVGEHVTSLTLNKCSLFGEDYIRKLLYQTFPNLQFLKMDNCKFPLSTGCLSRQWSYYYSSDDNPSFTEPACGVQKLKALHLSDCYPGWYSMVELLSHFSMLNSLHMNFFPSSSSCDILGILNIIKAIRAQDPTKLPIKDLDVGEIHLQLEAENQAESMEILSLLRELNIPLLRLVISLHKRSEPELMHRDIIRDVLRQHHSTLKFLGGTAYLEPPSRQFPYGLEFENLEQVEIAEGFCDNLNWLKYTPNLQSLGIVPMNRLDRNWNADNLVFNTSQLEIGNWTLPSLKRLRSEVFISADNMKKLMKWMPNVETLEFDLDDDIFPLVCKHWNKLKSLTDVWGGMTDQGVLGGDEVDGIAADDIDGGTQIGPNISMLKCLTYFETSSKDLTARSVYNGFLRMPSLKTVIGPFLNTIDKEAVGALQRQGITVHSPAEPY